MTLTEYTPDYYASKPSRRVNPSFVYADTKNGLVVFSMGAAELLGLLPQSQVKFIQDKDDPENWFIEQVAEGGFVINQRKALVSRTDRRLGLFCKNLARDIFDSVQCKEKAGRMIMSTHPVEINGRKLYPLITKSLFKPEA